MKDKNFSFYANISLNDLFAELQTSADGLTHQQADQRYVIYGPNEISQTTITWFTLLKNQLVNPFIGMFFIVAAIYFFTNQLTESITVVIIMVINSVIGFYQEYQSNQAMSVLRSYLQAMVVVRRAQKTETIAVNTIVPGDIVELKAGDIVPADCRLIASDNLVVDESSLTGESVPVKKSYELPRDSIKELYQATTICFAGTVIADGKGVGVVYATGKNTEFGSIAELTIDTNGKSSVTKGTVQLAKVILILVVTSLIIIVLINVFMRPDRISLINILFFAAALAITAIPSALPIVITFCLTRGAMILRKHKIIVKRLSAIEDLGGVQVLCTDKTGTLTENTLHIDDVYSSDNNDMLFYAALASYNTTHTVTSRSFDMAIEQALTPEQQAVIKKYVTVKELPFTYERHRSITVVSNKENSEYVVITKGSAEYVMTQCPLLSDAQKKEIDEWIKDHEMSGQRVLAVAIKKISMDSFDDNVEKYDTSYDEIALISFSDPLKLTALDAVKKAQLLGVTIKVFSGDSPYVCFSIAQQLGLENDFNHVVHGLDFEKSSEEQKMFLVNSRTIFARVTPQQKYQMIAYLQDNYSVGYMGDGINDAPALKIANVGIAVKDAAPVAREAAEIIMIEKSLHDIVLGIEQGRRVIINTLKYIKITIASNVGNFYSLALSSLLIDYLPMLPLQLLFLDLITDFPLIAISTDTVTHQELKNTLQFSMKDLGYVIFLFGLISCPFDWMTFIFFRDNEAILQTNWFIASAFTQLALIFSLRTKVKFWRAHPPSLALSALCLGAIIIVAVVPLTQWGQKIFLFSRPTFYDFLIISGISVMYFITTEIVKVLYYGRRKGTSV